MIAENELYPPKSLLALSLSLEGNRNKKMTKDLSETNISNNLVTLVRYPNLQLTGGSGRIVDSKGFGSGLMITEDGWILTAYHVVKPLIEDFKTGAEYAKKEIKSGRFNSWSEEALKIGCVMNREKNIYPMDPLVYSWSPDYDLAIVKAVIMKEPKPVYFKTAQAELDVGAPLTLLASDNGELCKIQGYVKEKRASTTLDADPKDITTTKDSIFTDIYVKNGFSGSPLINENGEFSGMALYKTNLEGKEYGPMGGSQIQHIKDLIKETVYIYSAGLGF